jgi:Lon protease-like protein
VAATITVNVTGYALVGVGGLALAGGAWFAGGMTDMAMFPLGSVLFPHMPLPLRVFEDRYLVMLSELLPADSAEFGVVLIERGQEVGGGEQRFGFGTVAQIVQLEAAEGFVALLAQGERRIEITEWLDEAPYPRARVREIDNIEWDAALEPLRATAEHTVRRALAVASEFADQQWAANVELSDDPTASIWQLAAIAPLGPLDQVALLHSTSAHELLTRVIALTEAAEADFGAGLSDDWSDEE